MSYRVIDDFCPQIEKVVASAHGAGFGTWLPNKGEVGSSVYEGMGFWGDHALMLRPLMAVVGGIVVPNTMFFRTTNIGMENAYIHSDRETGSHSCIAYLSAHNETSGTAFYRHKPTGLAAMPSFAEMDGNSEFDELKRDMVERTPEHWEQVDFVAARYNRALIFPAPLFHSRFPLDGFGDSPESGRLVWASHFYLIDQRGEFA